MAGPNSERYKWPSIISPRDSLSYRGMEEGRNYAPEGIILNYQTSLIRYALGLEGDQFINNGLYPLVGKNNKVGIHLGAFGALHASMTMEDLIVLGSKRFLTIGVAGGLQESLKPGDIVVCDRAIRDEGIADLYLEPGKYVDLSFILTSKLEEELTRQRISFRKGTTWTPATLYRETIPEAQQHQEDGVLTVELETAALAAVAKYREVEFGAAFVISDSLANGVWKPRFHLEEIRKGLENLYQVAVAVL